jgi:hypothetical protein
MGGWTWQGTLGYKTKLCLCLANEALLHGDLWGVDVQTGIAMSFDGSYGSLVRFTFRPLYSREQAYGTYSTGGWIGPVNSLANFEKMKSFTPQEVKIRPFGRRVRRFLISSSLLRNSAPEPIQRQIPLIPSTFFVHVILSIAR